MGIRTVDGETRNDYVLGDGIPHEEFYPNIESLKTCLIDLFSLVPVDDAYFGVTDEEAENEGTALQAATPTDADKPQAASPTDTEGPG